MTQIINRKHFIKISALSAVGLILTSCGLGKDEPDSKAEKPKRDSTPKNDSLVHLTDNVIYVLKEDDRYENLNTAFNKRIHKEPKIIALCKNTQGVSEAMHYAIENKLQVSVKSGGHSFEGFSSNFDGLVINLSLLNKIDWKNESEVKIGPGCKLHQLYDELLPEKKLIPAGSCAGVGIGGLTLGGGYGFFSRKYGLTCDSLKELTLVDGKGEIHSSNDRPELLWACKGGGNGNFGVVTEMTFTTHPAPATFTSHRFKAFKLDASRTKQILQKWFELAEQLPEACFSAFVLNHKTLTILVTNYEEHTPALQTILDGLSPLCDKTTSGNPILLQKALKTFYGIQEPIYFKNASAGLYKNFSDIEACISDVIEKVITTSGLIYQVNTLGGAINKNEFQDSAYAHRALPFLSELQAYYDRPERGESLMRSFEEIQTLFHNNNIKAQYVNYPDLNFKNWQEAYYGENYSRLVEIKKKYDPNNSIHHEQSITA